MSRQPVSRQPVSRQPVSRSARGRGWVTPVVLVALAALVRLVLALLGWPETDSDEATIGLAALHIGRDGAHPAYFYGQDYMGTLEA